MTALAVKLTLSSLKPVFPYRNPEWNYPRCIIPCRYSAIDQAHVLWGAGIKEQSDLVSLLDRLNAANMPTIDISTMESAQLHLRHLVGGRARSFTGTVPNERIYQISFPEKPRALQNFLAAICPTWNVTLFHYRTTGNRESSVLLGLQVRLRGSA